MKALVVANWKMNPAAFKEAKALFDESKRLTGLLKDISLVVCPPALYLRDFASGLRKGRVSLGLQNAHFESGGAHTGEISMQQAADSKATYVILGHAERRAAGESDSEIQKKVVASLAADLTPILCVGERERDSSAEHFNFVREQLRAALTDIPEKKIAKIVIAYEPVWAIGGKEAMKPRDMHEMSIFIRKTIVEHFGDVGHSVKVLYGGAVAAGNAGAMLRDGDVKGFLVGRAMTAIPSMTDLLRAINEA